MVELRVLEGDDRGDVGELRDKELELSILEEPKCVPTINQGEGSIVAPVEVNEDTTEEDLKGYTFS